MFHLVRVKVELCSILYAHSRVRCLLGKSCTGSKGDHDTGGNLRSQKYKQNEEYTIWCGHVGIEKWNYSKKERDLCGIRM